METTTPSDRVCSMCGGTAAYRGVFGDYDGFGCPDRGCGHTFLVRRESPDPHEFARRVRALLNAEGIDRL